MTSQRTRISQKDFFALAKYIEENAGSFEGKSRHHVASVASKALGIEIAVSSAVSAAQAAGVALGRGTRKGRGAKGNNSRALAKIIKRIVVELDMESSLTPSQIETLNAIAEHPAR